MSDFNIRQEVATLQASLTAKTHAELEHFVDRVTMRSKPEEQKSASDFKLSNRSLVNLSHVHPLLCKIVQRAIKITTCDFGVTEGLRTAERQRYLFEKGRSQLDGEKNLSFHQMQPSGYSHAVDLAAYLEGCGYVWEMELYDQICYAIRNSVHVFENELKEAKALVRWGACWSFITPDFDPLEERMAYLKRKADKGKKPFVDGPHFELHVG